MKRTIAISTALAVAALALPASAPANDSEIRRAGECTGGSTSKIKVKPDDGRLEVEFEVDQNRNDQRWRVRMVDNGILVFEGTRRTQAPSGSFSVERRIDNLPGTDSIRARARNPKTGERCLARVSI